MREGEDLSEVVPPTRQEHLDDDAAPTRIVDAREVAAARIADAASEKDFRQTDLDDDAPTRQVDLPDTAVTRHVDPYATTGRTQVDPQDSTPTRHVDLFRTQQVDPDDIAATRVVASPDNAATQRGYLADAAPTVVTGSGGYGSSPHGNQLGPQFRRLPPELDAKYLPLRDLRGGSQADVLVAEDRDNGREVVIKLYRTPGNPYDAATSTKLGQADTTHVVRVLDRGSSNGHAWEVQEYCAHGTLLEAQALRPPLSEARFHTVVAQLGLALAHLHGLSIVHRDLKPANVLVRGAEPLDLALTDFGLSAEIAMSVDIGSIAGTFPYMPPEAHYGEIGRSGDWWALGVMAYELLAGRHFLADASGRMPNEAKIRHAIATGDYVIDRVGNDRQWLLLRGLMARNRKNRWDAVQFQEWLAGGSPAVIPDERPTAPTGTAPTIVASALPRTLVANAPAGHPGEHLAPTRLQGRGGGYGHHAAFAPSPTPDEHTPPPQVPNEVEQAKNARRIARRSAERGLRQKWRGALIRRVITRLIGAAAWCLFAGTLLAAYFFLSTPITEARAHLGELSGMYFQYAPAAVLAVAISFIAEAIFLRRPWSNKILAITGAFIGLEGTFTPSGGFAGLPVTVPLYFVGCWVLSLVLGWITARVGRTFPGGVPLTPGEANQQRPLLARTLFPFARVGGSLSGGIGLTTWFFFLLPVPGGPEAVIQQLDILLPATAWLSETIPQIDPLGVTQDPFRLAMFGLVGYLFAAFSNDLHRLFRPLIWIGIVGAIVAGLIVFFAVPSMAPLALPAALLCLFTIRTSRSTV
ncbi:MAG: protein kinase [Tessaracoccus sp.]